MRLENAACKYHVHFECLTRIQKSFHLIGKVKFTPKPEKRGNFTLPICKKGTRELANTPHM